MARPAFPHSRESAQDALGRLEPNQMRDIREDLEARRREMIARHGDVMHGIEVEMDRLVRERRDAVAAFDKERATLDAMIALENARLGSNEQREMEAATDLTLRDLIVSTVCTRQPIDRDELREIVRAAGFAESGRTFNMTLQNVIGGGAIKKLPNGSFVDGRPLASLLNGAKQEESSMTQ